MSILNLFKHKKLYRLKENYMEDAGGESFKCGQVGVFVGYDSFLMRVRFDTYTVSIRPQLLELV